MQWVPDAHALASTILLLSRFLMSITFPLRIKRIARRGRPSYFSGESRGLGSRLPFRSCFCCRPIEMNLLVHVIDPIDPDEVAGRPLSDRPCSIRCDRQSPSGRQYQRACCPSPRLPCPSECLKFLNMLHLHSL